MADESTDHEPEEEYDEGPTLFEYLMSPEGKAVADRVLGVFESIQKATLDRLRKQDELVASERRTTTYVQLVIMLATLVGGVFLSYNDKLTSTVGVLLGTLLGFAFGRRGT